MSATKKAYLKAKRLRRATYKSRNNLIKQQNIMKITVTFPTQALKDAEVTKLTTELARIQAFLVSVQAATIVA